MHPAASRRLLFVLPHTQLGGGETATLALIDALEALPGQPWQIDVCAIDHEGNRTGLDLRANLTARWGHEALLPHRWQLRHRLRATDLVVWYGTTPAVPKVLRRMTARPASVRVVHTERPEDGPAFAHRWHAEIDTTVAVSPRIARTLQGAMFLPNTLDLDRIEGEPIDAFPDSLRPTLGVLGRLVPLKNVGWLVDQLPGLDCNLLLQVIDTELSTRRQLLTRAHQLGVGDRVHFLPPSPRVGTLLRSIDALALVSQHEGLPMTVLEAGWLATPVIATPVGALPALFGDALAFVPLCDDGQPDRSALRRQAHAIDASSGMRLQRAVHACSAPPRVAASWHALLRSTLARRKAAA